MTGIMNLYRSIGELRQIIEDTSKIGALVAVFLWVKPYVGYTIQPTKLYSS
jgi:hypothetical protein